jgi:hypothetical protein
MTAVAPKVETMARDVPGAETLAGAVRLFFRFPTPRILAAKLAAVVALRAWVGGIGWADAAIVAGVAVYWPLQEWLLHSKLLHLRPRTLLGVQIDPVFARYHRYHHRHPWVLERTFLPTRVLVPLLPLNVALWWIVTPSWGLALTGMGALTTAAALYEWTHYLTHTPYRPRSGYYRRIHKNHMLHHFKDEQAFFAFTVPAMDALLGTNVPSDSARPAPPPEP